jgi:hypothetical protein
MKKVFTARKHSYGTGFFEECDSLDELKKAIVAQELYFEDKTYTDELYTDELFKKWVVEGEYALYEVNLHDDEYISFSEYDGQSSFYIEKKDRNILSTMEYIDLEGE